jgi:N-acetylmuramoyl-L-alanine amidase
MLIRPGQRSSAVRDVQHRLLVLGYDVAPEERSGFFGPTTSAAVREFQQRRGLVVDGLVGDESWRELVEASWRLGERTLYLRATPLRGDDVRRLQEQLGALGFDAGRVDGIFGPRTARAVRDFQANYGIPADAIVGRSTLRALEGLPHVAGETSVAGVREREELRRLGPALSGLRVVVDPGHGGGDPGNVGPGGLREDAACMSIARGLEAALSAGGVAVYLTREADQGPSESERATLANALAADLYVAIHAGGSTDRGARGAAAYYFGHERFRSESGFALAEQIQESVVATGMTDARAHAKTWAVLRETRMPAVQVEPCHITNPDDERLLGDPGFQHRVAEAITAGMRAFLRQPVS